MYKCVWNFSYEFTALLNDSNSSYGNYDGEFEFDKSSDDSFFPAAEKLIEICNTAYPDGDADLAAFDDVNDDYIYIMKDGEQIKAVEFKILEMPWYAVTSDDYHDWDDGSYDLDEAKKMAAEYVAEGKSGVEIAVIQESKDFCVNGYTYDEEYDRFILENPNDRDFLYGFPV